MWIRSPCKVSEPNNNPFWDFMLKWWGARLYCTRSAVIWHEENWKIGRNALKNIKIYKPELLFPIIFYTFKMQALPGNPGSWFSELERKSQKQNGRRHQKKWKTTSFFVVEKLEWRNLFKWKTTSKKMKMEDDLNFLWKSKTTSIFLKMEDELIFI